MRSLKAIGKKRVCIIGFAWISVFLMVNGVFASGGGDAVAHGGNERLWNLLYRAINFTFLVIILFVVIRKTSVKNFFSDRRKAIKNNFEELNRKKRQAEERYKELSKQLEAFEKQKKEIIEQYRSEGQQEKERIITEAEKRAKHILEQAEASIQRELQAAGDKIKRDVLDRAAKNAQEILLKEMQEKDQDQLVDDFIDRIQREKAH